ncbi:GYD domain-containing protein [Micromonospora sp. NPDC049679]|uniref:GYD domain-containing protein n=1 Tax=Micromonospora sp. NPDC049679 TaxID=3155920 RepID=UPI0033E570D3
MARFLIKASYTQDGLKGLLKEGGTARRDAAAKVVGSLGGKLESFYFSLGEEDLYLVCELPDVKAVMALTIHVNADGGSIANSVELLSCEEIDAVVKQKIDFAGPGS